MLTLLLLMVAAVLALCILPFALMLMLRAAPLFIGLLLCWWMFQACC